MRDFVQCPHQTQLCHYRSGLGPCNSWRQPTQQLHAIEQAIDNVRKRSASAKGTEQNIAAHECFLSIDMHVYEGSTECLTLLSRRTSGVGVMEDPGSLLDFWLNVSTVILILIKPV